MVMMTVVVVAVACCPYVPAVRRYVAVMGCPCTAAVHCTYMPVMSSPCMTVAGGAHVAVVRFTHMTVMCPRNPVMQRWMMVVMVIMPVPVMPPVPLRIRCGKQQDRHQCNDFLH